MITTQAWIATDIAFTSKKTMTDYEKFGLDFYAEFISESGKKLTVPAFWHGGNRFTVRLAPTETGVWKYKTVCSEDASLDNLCGEVLAEPYLGEYEIYKHGFVKTQRDKKYFIYDDGTPFFYLGDTHWSMMKEEYDSSGDSECNIESHFKYSVDKRASQGYTVYQSETIDAPFEGDIRKCLFTEKTVEAFNTADMYFSYIAQKGLVHTNAQFFFSAFMNKDFMEKLDYMEKISRYWVARFGAYPVMWTLGQEIDNDRYLEHGDHKLFTIDTNPWVKIAEYIHKYDTYAHPLTGHQEHYARTTVTGKGTDPERASSGGRSAFLSDEVTEKTGHTWYASQWSTPLSNRVNLEIVKDYYNSYKVAVDYESAYCNQDTKDFGARVRGWIAYLSGFFGYGYGVRDIWYYKTRYQSDTTKNDGYEEITPEDKKIKWFDALELKSGYQVCYMKEFFEKLEWWKLVPDCTQEYFTPDEKALYACASIGNETAVIYLYNRTADTGVLRGLEKNSDYSITVFDTVNNKYEKTVTKITDDSGSLPLPKKQENTDCVFLVKRG